MANWMKRTDKHYKVQCGDLELLSTMYEIDVTGYGSKCGRLRLFDLDTVNERLIGSGTCIPMTAMRTESFSASIRSISWSAMPPS